MKDKTVAALLAIFLGGFGIHKFYLGRPIQGIFYILFCWTFIPAILGFLEGLVYLSTNQAEFNKKYGDATASAPASPMKKCPFCAEEIKMEAIKCKHCGSSLTEKN